ncbi:tetratricopeptide repeat protein [Nonomuraea sp. MCN248]|uniref:Tetratricopeptide repeat protein n=1 Tax=Nonomuraea corallina TaxID=2989783 RepID=A0ABT4S4N0_9ACTN|nr:tetratricopeptide repeat protein [Nonomuraea corallina]MDA0632134.1 tetratricopeptide repeat protein [Nonomuraea corallina]
MSRLNLRAAFALGLASPISAQQIFTNRVSEIGAFDRSIEVLASRLEAAEISPVTDRRVPRWNVLVYYGVGGIGKTTLSTELERRFMSQDERAAVRVDFAESAVPDVESYVLRLRAGLGHLARRWPAFDLALCAYWERAHPGRPLEEFINGDSMLSRTSQAIGLPEQITGTIAEVIGVLPGVGEVTHRVGSLLYNKAAKAIANHRTLKRCELLGELLEADADVETLSYFPYLLAWDLDRLPEPHPRAAVFLDTYENAGGRHHRDFERFLQRSVFLMPNVLFVITGRNRIDWADVDELDFPGPERWPGLHADNRGEEPRQHLVGYLSADDADDYLRSAMVRDDTPVMDAAIRERIVAAGSGLPLYLDLAVTRYLDLLARGRMPTAEDFGQPLRTVAARVLRDLGQHERELLRTAALLDTFDLGMLGAGCPATPDAALRTFKDRSFLEVDPAWPWPYSLHQVLREALREADVDLADSWSSRERAEVADRLTAHLGQVCTAAAARGDRNTEVAAFRQALLLCAYTDRFPYWLVDAAQRLLLSGRWNHFPDFPQPQTAASALLLGLRGARERRSGQLEQAIAATEQALALQPEEDRLRHFLLLHHAHALRVAGRYAHAAEHYLTLTTTGANGFATEAGYWLADYRFLVGDFGAALASLDALGEQHEELMGEILRLRGHVYRVNALFANAESVYRRALALARDSANFGAEGKALTDLIQTLAWQRPREALRLLPDAQRINETISNQIELVKLHAATAVALVNQARYDEAEQEIARGLTLTIDCGYPGGEIWCWSARAYSSAVRASEDEHATATAHLTQITATLGGNRFWGQIAAWWNPSGNGAAFGDIDWIDGTDATRRRWTAIIPREGRPR